MSYVEIGSTIIWNHEEAKVIDQYREDEKRFWVLETSEGVRAVPAVKIMWNGKNHFVTPDGYEYGNMMMDAEKIISEIKREMKIWDRENVKPVGFHREEAIDSHFMHILRSELDKKSDEEIGFIVKKVVKALDEI